jgi:hypothetical protein
VILLGDSLAVGMRPFMPAHTTVDARVGRPTREGIGRLGALHPSHRLLVSLGSNDPDDPKLIRWAVRQTLRFVGPDGVVVWATVPGHPRANRALLDRNRDNHRLRVVRWARWAGRHRGSMTPDLIHCTSAAGYQVRARMFLEALPR